jgi:hypothetical protein
MMFKKLVGIWVLVLIVVAIGLAKPQSPLAKLQPQHTATAAPQAASSATSAICNEGDWDCRKEAEKRRMFEEDKRHVLAMVAERQAAASAAEENRIKALKAAQYRLQAAADEAEVRTQEAAAAIRQQSQIRIPTHSYSYWYSWSSAPRRTCNPFSPRCNY